MILITGAGAGDHHTSAQQASENCPYEIFRGRGAGGPAGDQLHPYRQPQAAHVSRAAAGRQAPPQGFHQVGAHLGGVLHQPLVQQGGEGGQPGRAGEGVAAEGAAVVGGQGAGAGVHDIAGAGHHTDREAPADPFTRQEKVGNHPGVLEGPHAPGAPPAGEDLVEHQQRPGMVAECPQPFQEIGRDGDHSARPL